MTSTPPLILGFDTSAAHCAVSLLSGELLVAEALEVGGRGQTERLFPLLEEVLASYGASWRDLGALGVGIGPGNFTGIRIAVSAARGLALSLGIPAIGIGTLEALAYGLPRPVIAALDGRQGALYVQSFTSHATGLPVRVEAADLHSLALPVGAACIGDGAPQIAQLTGSPVLVPTCPLAEAIARLATTRLGSAHPRPSPLYLRSADAAPARDTAPVLLP